MDVQSSDAAQLLRLALETATRLVGDLPYSVPAVEKALEGLFAAMDSVPCDAACCPIKDHTNCSRLQSQSVPHTGHRLTRQSGHSEPSLSARETSILEYVSHGLSNKQIAKTLKISPETVKSHVSHIFIKLDVEKRAQAVARAQDLGLIRRYVATERAKQYFP